MNMIKFTKIILLVTMLGVVTISCKKDGEDPTPQKTNAFTIDGTEYSLSAGFTEEYGGSETTGYNFDLTVHSSGLTLLDYLGNEVNLTGQGEELYFELWSTSATGLTSGTYTVSTNEAPNTITYSEIYINLNASNGTADAGYEATSGSVTINVNASAYNINFDLTLSGNKKLTGNYTGALTEY